MTLYNIIDTDSKEVIAGNISNVDLPGFIQTLREELKEEITSNTEVEIDSIKYSLPRGKDFQFTIVKATELESDDDEPEVIDESEMDMDWLMSKANVSSDGLWAFEKWLDHVVGKDEVMNIDQMWDTLSSFKSDIEDFCLPSIEKMEDKLSDIERGIEDGSIVLREGMDE